MCYWVLRWSQALSETASLSRKAVEGMPMRRAHYLVMKSAFPKVSAGLGKWKAAKIDMKDPFSVPYRWITQYYMAILMTYIVTP